MTKNIFELKLCSNGYYYLWKDNELYTTSNGDYIYFDKFIKSEVNDLIDLLNDSYIEREVIKDKLLNQILDYDKIAHDNYVAGLSESVEGLQEEVKELFRSPMQFMIINFCDDCKHFKEITYPKGKCLKHGEEFEDIDIACEDFEWK